nr:hypothetical protein [uncultured Psychroserpens sp.]
MNKKILCILLLLAFSCKSKILPVKEIAKNATKQLGPNPYYEVDGKSVDKNTFMSLNPDNISTLTIYYDEEAIDLFNEKGKDGAITIQTIAYAKKKYQSLFKSYSSEYNEIINEYSENEIQYILNGRILKDDFEGKLSLIDEKLLKSIKIIDSSKLNKKYEINDKKVGVVIKAKRPKNLYNSKEKF